MLEKKRFGKTFLLMQHYIGIEIKNITPHPGGENIERWGVLFNQSIHLLDVLIYFFGKIKNFNVVAGFSKDKLQAEDLISVNLNHTNKVISNLKATTRAKEIIECRLMFCVRKEDF